MRHEFFSPSGVAFTKNNLVIFTASVFSPEVRGIYQEINFLDKKDR